MEIVGGAITVSVAFAVDPVSATGPVAVGAAVVLLAAPAVDDVTFTSTWHVAPAARLATLNWISRCPAVSAPKTPAPTAARDCTVPHAAGVKVAVAGAATLMLNVPSGSVTTRPVSAAPLEAGLVKMRRSALVPPEAMVGVTNDLASVGGV